MMGRDERRSFKETQLKITEGCKFYSETFVYITKAKCDFFINQQYLFMWDLNYIQYIDLTKQVGDESLNELNFKIDPLVGGQARIKGIRYGSNPNLIAIVVE